MLLKGREMTSQLGTLGPKEQHGDEFPEFSSCFMYPILSAEQASKPQMLQVAREENFNRKPALYSQGNTKRAAKQDRKKIRQ